MSGPAGQRPAWLIGLAAGILAVMAVALALTLPPRVPWLGPSWHDQGVRLFRDDVEMKVYFDRSRWLAAGAAPYTAGYEQEYPPLAVAFFALPRFVSGDFHGYEKVFLALNAAFYGLLFGLIVWLLRRFGRPARLAGLLCLPAAFYFSMWRFDIISAVLVALMVWGVVREKYHLALLALAAAAAAKYYPAIFLIPLLMLMGGLRLAADQLRRLRTVLAILGLSVLLLGAALALTSGFGLLTETVVHHLTRKFEIGSLAALVVSTLSAIDFSAEIGLRLVSLSFVLLQAAATVLLVLRGRISERTGFVRACLFVLMPFILFNRFYSQQWLLWITPLYLLVARRREVAALVIYDLLSFLQFPIFFDIDPYGAAFTVSTLVRSAVLAYLIYANGREMAAAGYLSGPRRATAAPASAPT